MLTTLAARIPHLPRDRKRAVIRELLATLKRIDVDRAESGGMAMAFYRSISRDFFNSEDIVILSPLARLLYIATWLEADREGRLVWRPKTLKLRYLPGDACDIEALAGELVQAGLVIPYDADGQTFAEIPSFTRHQSINNREAAA